jgi:hypothetical protein
MKQTIRTFTFIAALLGIACVFSCAAHAQTNGPLNTATITALLNQQLITLGQPATINGQTFIVTTNASGGYTVTTTGPNGALTVTPATTLSGALSTAEQYVNANNPTNANYYGTNEIVVSVGAVYLQNSGQAAVDIGIQKYGLLSAWPNFSVGADLYQGNKSGQSGTAGGAGWIGYRKIIGDVSAQVDVGGGYDNWNATGFAAARVEVEYRQNPHLAEYVGVGYALEGTAFSKTTATQSSANAGGLIVGGGIRYAF